EVTAEEIPQAFEDALGSEIEEHFMRAAWLRNLLPDELGDKQFGLRPGVAREDIALSNSELGFGFTRATMRLTRTEGPRWTHEVDEHIAAIVAGLNPQGLNLRETLELYAGANDYEADEVFAAALPAITDLVRHGFLYPTDVGPVIESPQLPQFHTHLCYRLNTSSNRRYFPMRAVLTRCLSASVTVDDEVVGSFEASETGGILALIGVSTEDIEAGESNPSLLDNKISTMARKIAELRILDGESSV